MFRARLAAVIAVLVAFVLLLGWMLYWGAGQLSQNFQSSQSAYEAFDQYERLSQQAYRHFKQRMDRLATGQDDADAERTKQQLDAAIALLKQHAVAAAANKSAQDWQTQSAELEQVARFTAFLEASEYRFNEVEHLRKSGRAGEALSALAKFSEEEIDNTFQPLIDTAIEAERDKAQTARTQHESLIQQSRWVASLAALAVALFGLASGIWLLRGIGKPIEALMQGTNAIAAGNLGHRIALPAQDEFGHLASHFNRMAGELAAKEEKLRDSHAVLEQRVAERTAELHQLNATLQRMDTERREFLADISHELRTPITVIQGEVEVTLRAGDCEPEEYKDTLERIAELSEQLGKYVNDLMFLARAETAHLQFVRDTLDFAQLVADAASDFQVLAQESSLSVRWETPATPVWVLGDRQRLRQVLFILGDNACRYSNPGGHIAAALRIDGEQAVFKLSDHGIGIPAEDLERIFDRHFRSPNALQSREDGSGLGLPMAKAILKAHGGQIAVASAENAGTTFTITLPLVSTEYKEQFTDERTTLQS